MRCVGIYFYNLPENLTYLWRVAQRRVLPATNDPVRSGPPKKCDAITLASNFELNVWFVVDTDRKRIGHRGTCARRRHLLVGDHHRTAQVGL